MDEQARAAQLGRAWDTFKRADLAGCDPADIAMIRSLMALDRQPAPDPGFVATLEGALMRPRTLQKMPSHPWSTAQATGSRVDSRDVWTFPEWGRSPSWPRRTAAMVAVLVCGVLVFSVLQTGSNDDGRPTSLPAYGDASSVCPLLAGNARVRRSSPIKRLIPYAHSHVRERFTPNSSPA
jgi:hypothetical protein